jgi:hypothetical protein
MVVDCRRPGRKGFKKARTMRCFLNGEDITRQTFYADTKRGIARVFLLNENGRPYVAKDRKAATATWRGQVRLARGV